MKDIENKLKEESVKDKQCPRCGSLSIATSTAKVVSRRMNLRGNRIVSLRDEGKVYTTYHCRKCGYRITIIEELKK